MDALSPDIARKLLTRDFANLAQRVQRGANLSRSEKDARHFPFTHPQPRTLPSSKTAPNRLAISQLQHLPQAKKPSIRPIPLTKVTAH